MANPAAHNARELKLVAALRAARNRLQLSQTALAAILCRTQQFVSKYESGERQLNFLEVVDIATALGLTIPHLLHEIDHEEGLGEPSELSSIEVGRA